MYTMPIDIIYGDKLGIRNFLEMKENPMIFLYNAHRTCGPTVSMRCGPYRILSLTENEHIEHILKINANNYVKRTPGYAGMREYLGRGILTHEGGRSWRAQGKNIRPLFHPGHVRDFTAMMLKWVDIYCEEIKETPLNESINLSRILRRLTLSILCDAMFGFDNQRDIAGISDDISIGIQYAFAKLYDPFFRFSARNRQLTQEFRAARRRLREYANKIIDHKCSDETTLPNLLSSRGVDRRLIIDEIITMLQAGHETSATALNAMFFRAFKNKKILSEIEKASAGLQGAELTNNESFDYVNQFIWESLRYDPSTWAFDRYTLKGDEFSGLKVRRGDLIVVSPYVKHRLFGGWEDPENFNPEVNFPVAECKRSKDFIPFSLGPRICPGSTMAHMEMRAIVAKLLRTFSFECHELEKISLIPSITLKLSSDLICNVEIKDKH